MKPSSMLSAVNAYLEERRRLGYALMIEGEELLRFAKYADESGHNGPITTELAIRWAKLPVHANPLYWARRLDMVRRLAKHQIMSEPGTEIPPNGILGPSYRRPTPYIYTSDEISALLTEAARLGPPNGIRPHTYRTLFGLLACTGLRISEALRLTRSDVDLQARLLRITQSKFRKERWVPIHSSTAGALSTYAHRRDRHLPLSTETRFFLTERGTPLKYHRTYMTFRKIREKLGWTTRSPLPRIHDLRHTFAVRTLLRWYEEGAPIGNRVASLATYLGHVKVSDTYWYLSAVPELLSIAASRFEDSVSGKEVQSQ